MFNMQKLSLTLLLILGLFEISTACEDILRGCSQELSAEADQLTGLPNEEELRRICPVLLDTFECIRKKSLKCKGKTPEEAAQSASDVEDAAAAQLYLNIQAVAKELCNEESNLHKSYIRTQSCTREYFSVPKLECKREAEAAYAAYRDLTESLPEENAIDSRDSSCLMEAYAFACLAHDLQTTCNEEARNVFLGIFQRLKIATILCSATSLEELKTNFLESLDMEAERKDIFASAFDVLKKRRK